MGSAVLSFRAMALSALWPEAVAATYSMSSRLDREEKVREDAVKCRWENEQERAQCYCLYKLFSSLTNIV